ncbi:MAG: DUF2299 domain-containing protein [Sulfolobales archaeon]|jgi:Uncharacterized conserved protein|nr:DUF2299 domain-containing protein [Sulfolobales archaeon]MDT7906081.1 DUF2299 domain-containing protein [Sulfolobales archaeon]
MASDAEVVNWFVELGMKVEKVTSGNYYFHITIGPPVGEGLKVSVLRKTPSSKYYVIAVNLDLPEDELKERPELLRELKLDLLRMNVEFVFMPPDREVPRTVQIAKLAFLDGLTSNEMLNLVTLVKNAAYLVLTRIYG